MQALLLTKPLLEVQVVKAPIICEPSMVYEEHIFTYNGLRIDSVIIHNGIYGIGRQVGCTWCCKLGPTCLSCDSINAILARTFTCPSIQGAIMSKEICQYLARRLKFDTPEFEIRATADWFNISIHSFKVVHVWTAEGHWKNNEFYCQDKLITVLSDVVVFWENNFTLDLNIELHRKIWNKLQEIVPFTQARPE